MSKYTVVGIYPDGEAPEGQALESFVEVVDATSPEKAVEAAITAADGREKEYVVAVFAGVHYDIGPFAGEFGG